MTPAEAVTEYLRQQNINAAIVVDGSADEIVEGLVAAGWTLEEGAVLVAGKRIRVLVPPACLFPCDPDCESGRVHCRWVHEPSHKPGWHSPADCPMKGLK